MPRSKTRSPSRACSQEVDYGRSSTSRSRSKSVPPRPQPEWMETTARRLSAVAEAAETAVEQGGEALKAIYTMKPKDVNKALSSQPQVPLAETTTAQAAVSSQPPHSHHDTSLHLHRMTGGGKKYPSTQSGPIATSLNPERHTMMINGRPVVVLGVVKAAMSFQPYAMMQSFGVLVSPFLGYAVTPLIPAMSDIGAFRALSGGFGLLSSFSASGGLRFVFIEVTIVS